jgi:hypothetical protein
MIALLEKHMLVKKVVGALLLLLGVGCATLIVLSLLRDGTL